MTVNQLISDLRNIAESGSNAIEFRIEDSQLLFWANETRAMLISQALQKHQDISDIWVQQISCLELEEIDKSECCEIVTNCKILRSISQLPVTIETNGDNTILRVETIMGDIISKTNVFESKYNNAKYTKNKPKWFIKNNYLYIINEVYLKYVNIVGLFENPSDLAVFNTCEGVSCFNSSSVYPCSLKMANDITNIVLKTKIYPYLQTPQDNTNDANSGGTIPPNTKHN